jgi:translation initiation factor 3 subunit A
LLQKSFNKNLSQKDLQLIASSVVLAALSVPPHDRTHGASHLELEHEKERNLRMANLIGFNLETKSDSREMVFYSPSFALVVLYRYICFANLTILLLFLFCLPSSQGHHFSLNW